MYREGERPLLETLREGLAKAISNADFDLPQGILVILTKSSIKIDNPGLLMVWLRGHPKGMTHYQGTL